MIQCNGLSLKDIQLKVFTEKDKIYYDNLCMFDIEVSTCLKNDNNVLVPFSAQDPYFYKSHKSYSLMYLWNMCIDGYLFSGRCTDDLLAFFESFNEMLDGIFYVYVHNLSYEFQFLRNIFNDEMEVFARKKRHPLKFRWRNIEFRCSYMLTRLSLDNWAKEKNLPVQKLTGMFDYNVLRTPVTKLSTLERDYGYNDVLVGVAGLQEYLETYKHVKDIPITQTSCIRKKVQKLMRTEYKAKKRVQDMTDIDIDLYRFLLRCFTGGYTHANCLYTDRVIENLIDFDLSSSYPWVMLSEMYPISKFVKSDDYIRFMSHPEKYCYAMTIEFKGIRSRYLNTYISASKCIEYEGILLDNGRVIEADRIVISILDVDYNIIKKAYHVDEERIIEFYYAMKGYLPDSFRRYLVELYKNKTSLKSILEKFDLYFKSKEEINGCYGMAVTKDITDEIVFTFDEETGKVDWGKDELTEEKYYEKVERKKRNWSKLSLSYSQGIYVPAYGRKNLWEAVHRFDDEIVYMDTDSIKTVYDDDIIHFVDEYNETIHKKQRFLANQLGISYDDFNPRDIKGNIHSIGCFERDEDIVKFKTLGAKRYICQYSYEKGIDYLKMTVSGVRKKAVYQLSSIDDFTKETVFDIDNAKKMLLMYNDSQDVITWNKGQYDEWECTDKYGIASINIEYRMGMSFDYFLLVQSVRDDITKIFKERSV